MVEGMGEGAGDRRTHLGYGPLSFEALEGVESGKGDRRMEARMVYAMKLASGGEGAGARSSREASGHVCLRDRPQAELICGLFMAVA